MFYLYAIALVGVSAVLLGVLLEAVVSVSRKPSWGHRRQMLYVMPVVERRVEQLPFVGANRRTSAEEEALHTEELRKRA